MPAKGFTPLSAKTKGSKLDSSSTSSIRVSVAVKRRAKPLEVPPEAGATGALPLPAGGT